MEFGQRLQKGGGQGGLFLVGLNQRPILVINLPGLAGQTIHQTFLFFQGLVHPFGGTIDFSGRLLLVFRSACRCTTPNSRFVAKESPYAASSPRIATCWCWRWTISVPRPHPWS